MNKLIYLIIAAIVCLAPLHAGAKKNVDKNKYMAEWANFEVTTVAVGQNGTKALKVWGFGKNVDQAVAQAKKNAVYACLFRGCPAAATARPTPAIFANQGNDQVAIENFEYFYDFFEQ